MLITINIIWILIGVIIIAFYNALLVLDDKTLNSDTNNIKIKKMWHTVGAVLFLYVAATAWIISGFKYVPFVLSSFWLLFGGIVHVVGLKKPFFFVGTTAQTDIILRKVFSKNPELGSIIVKSLLLLSSVFLIFFL
jgi:hypothetical protein